jgi:serine/threonine protein kinase/tetratricopeptide (TPR) repeat protein
MMMAHCNNNKVASFDEILAQFVKAYVQGDQPDVNELLAQYPQHEARIRQRVKNLIEIDALFDSLVEAEESDYEDTATGNDLVGRRIANFEIDKVIGYGGMGIVYLARDTKLKRYVAVKCISPKRAWQASDQNRFRREAELLASLNHPNIAVIHEIVEEDSSGYLILEYVQGETLAKRIACEPLSLEESLSIGLQIAEAISAAHQKAVVHRDLKPGNIKITPDNRIKVLDFGLAKSSVAGDPKNDITATDTGRVIGTPAYMSPEQARGQPTDYKTDIWSFGCILYQMLTGHLPFEGQTTTDTLARIIEREPDWQLLPERIPTNLRILLRRCLEKDLDRRLKDIAEACWEIRETLKELATPQTKKNPVKFRTMTTLIGILTLAIVLACIVLRHMPQEDIPLSAAEIRLVVLPFENLGPYEDDYLANGITEAITARLGGIHSLGVISRQSAMLYASDEKSIPQIAEELDVDYILQGTVQREQPSDQNSRMRIIPQFVRVSDRAHIWSEIYDYEVNEIFHLQSDLGQRIAQALDITLLEPERQALQFAPTENMEAYQYYLRGVDYSYKRDWIEEDYHIAITMFEKAIELDPTFALAYARLSDVHCDMYWRFFDPSKERLTLARQAVDKAFHYNPHLPEAHLALGHYYYHGFLDYERALEQFAIARSYRPNTGEVLSWIGYVERRMGKFEQALPNLARAYELDPFCDFLAFDIAQTHMILRQYPEAEDYYNRAISLAPDSPDGYSWKAWLYLRWEGNTKKANIVLQEALQNPRSRENPLVLQSQINIDVFNRDYQEALHHLSLNPPDVNDQHYCIPNALRYAQVYKYMGEQELARNYFEKARAILKIQIQEMPQDARFHSSLGITYAGLDRIDDAIRAGKMGVKLLPVTREAWRGLNRVEDLARIYCMVGQYDLAIEQLEYLLNIPGEISIHLLQLDPVWTPLNSHLRFTKLISSNR